MSDNEVKEEVAAGAEQKGTTNKGKAAPKKGNKGSKSDGESVSTVKKGKILDAHIDSEPDVLLEWVQKGGSIAFDPDDLPKLSDEELEPFPYSTVKAYKEAIGKVRKSVKVETLDTLGGNANAKLKLRKRRGFHQTWKRPDELDDALDKGYVVIRDEREGESLGPGKERGVIKKIGKEDQAELIAMEVSQERYDNHVKAMTSKSREAYTANKQRFAGNVEQFNRNLPKDDRMKIIDDEGDVS